MYSESHYHLIGNAAQQYCLFIHLKDSLVYTDITNDYVDGLYQAYASFGINYFSEDEILEPIRPATCATVASVAFI